MGSRGNHNHDVDPFFPLVFAVADFTQQLSAIHERHADDLQILVEAFRKRNADLRKERNEFETFETFPGYHDVNGLPENFLSRLINTLHLIFLGNQDDG